MSTPPLRVRRALLFMPADDRRKIEKAAGLRVDSIIMDLEDGVALSNKATAREGAANALRQVDFGASERLVRINPVGSPFWRDDLETVLPAHPDGIVIAKTESAEHIHMVAEIIAHADARPSMALLAQTETALGILNLREIAQADVRLAALIFGAEDLAGDIGAQRTAHGEEVFVARSLVVLHAKAYGLQAIDTPFVGLDDEAGLRSDTLRAMGMGYTGKLAIHPKQIAPIEAAFMPTPDQIAAAQALIDAFNAHQSAGTGVFAYHGKMVDMPMIRAAQTVLARARAPL
jgi:citrate lyase beta subunit